MRVILKKDHKKDCAAVKQVKYGAWNSPWFLNGEYENKNKLGRGKGWHRWMKFICNSTSCPAHGLVLVSDIEVQIYRVLKQLVKVDPKKI